MRLENRLRITMLLFAARTQADVKLPQLFNNDMDIQRDTEAPVWGWADAGWLLKQSR
ncbi:MAG: hypothetical protein HQL32_07930 [Planctomycetes bacterium]|nr:hypothetical protein [Planctomycetota bacterium]